MLWGAQNIIEYGPFWFQIQRRWSLSSLGRYWKPYRSDLGLPASPNPLHSCSMGCSRAPSSQHVCTLLPLLSAILVYLKNTCYNSRKNSKLSILLKSLISSFMLPFLLTFPLFLTFTTHCVVTCSHVYLPLPVSELLEVKGCLMYLYFPGNLAKHLAQIQHPAFMAGKKGQREGETEGKCHKVPLVFFRSCCQFNPFLSYACGVLLCIQQPGLRTYPFWSYQIQLLPFFLTKYFWDSESVIPYFSNPSWW